MSGMDKTIKRVRELYSKRDEEVWQTYHDFTVEARDSIMPIITAYEESQKAKEEFKTELESSINCIKHLAKDHKEELETANKRIAEIKEIAEDKVVLDSKAIVLLGAKMQRIIKILGAD